MEEIDRRLEILDRMQKEYPGSAKDLCALKFTTPYQLLVATVLSAQCTDKKVNETTPALFAKYPTPSKMADAQTADVQSLIYSTGFYKTKAKNLIEMAQTIVSELDDTIPDTMGELSKLPGVGRKTANVVLSVAFDKPGLPVDTHVGRVSRRLQLTKFKDAVKVEKDLTQWIAPEQWGAFSLRSILHGRRICQARMPKCAECVLWDLCPSATLVQP